jgi:hypothetical protein
MAATKIASTLISSVTNAASGTTTQVTPSDLTEAYGMFVTARITNDATGPTDPCSFIVEVSNDSSTWREIATFTAGIENDGIFNFSFIVDLTIMYARVIFTGNTDESVTVESFAHIVTEV